MQNLKRIAIIILIIYLAKSDCSSPCVSCRINGNPYTCKTCAITHSLYLNGCVGNEEKDNGLLSFAVFVIVVHLFMVGIGFGVYREIYENIQMMALINWKYGFEKKTFLFEITNFGMIRGNNFFSNYGYQFLVFTFSILAFLGIYLTLGKNQNGFLATIIRRKRIIFPIRIGTLILNMTLFSSLLQITTVQSSNIKSFSCILSIFGVAFSLSILIAIGKISNSINFQFDDPHFYLLIEQMTSKKWYMRNNTLISLCIRSCIIISFILLFHKPIVSGLMMLALQIGYTVYQISFVRLLKIRYFVVLSLSNLVIIGLLLCVYLGAIEEIESNAWENARKVYSILYYVLVTMFMVVNLVQIYIRKDAIVKHFKSLFKRLVSINESDDKIVLNKYDYGINRQRVTLFHENLLYQPSQKKGANIQLPKMSS